MRRQYVPKLVPMICGAVCVLALGISASPGATSNVIVAASVLGATSLTPACAEGAAGPTDIGSVIPGTGRTTTSDCTMVFGSSNAVATLRATQSDGFGAAMYRPASGAIDGGFDGDATMVGYPGNGKVNVDTGATSADEAFALAMQPSDGHLVLGGWATLSGSGHFSLARLTTTGTLDTSFNGTGRVDTDIPGAGGGDTVRAVAVQPDGKILAAGYVDADASATVANDFAVARYTSAGLLDDTFGCASPPCAGYLVVDVQGTNQTDTLYDMALQDDGKVVLVGSTNIDATSWGDVAILRLGTNGVLDATFGSGGKVITPVGAGDSQPRAVTIDLSGRIVVTGSYVNGADPYDAFVARYTASGVLDTTFGCAVPPCSGINGSLVVSSGADDVRDVALHSDGRIVIAGWTTAGNDDMFVARYTTAGVLDTAFSNDGSTNGWDVNGTASSERGISVAVQGEGTITVAGWGDAAGTRDFRVVRYTNSGALDTGFGSSGVSTIDIDGGDEARAVVNGHDGHMAAAGFCTCGGTKNMAIVRYDALGLADYSNTGVAGDKDWNTGSNMFGACLRDLTGTGATQIWSKDGDGTCSGSDTTDTWYPIASSATAASLIASASTAGQNVTAQLRFGLRISNTQVPGTYKAPITFSVVSP